MLFRYGLGDVLGCCIDLDNHRVSYTKNGNDLGVAFEIPKALHGHAFFPTANVKNAELRCVCVCACIGVCVCVRVVGGYVRVCARMRACVRCGW